MYDSGSTHQYADAGLHSQLKTIEDSLKIRGRILKNFENASLPSTTPEEREKLLNFVVCGGGPTGVEFASELYDMISEDVTDYFPKLLREEAKVHIIQSRDHILNTYSEKISKYAEQRFSRNSINTILNARVKEVGTDHVSYTTKDENGKTVDHTIPSGFTLWSTGIGERCPRDQCLPSLKRVVTSHEPFHKACRVALTQPISQARTGS